MNREAWEDQACGSSRPPIGKEKADIERLQIRYRGGDGWALFQALEFCFVRALDMPGWVVGALLAGMGRYQRGAAADLGEAFGVARKAKRKRPSVGELFPLRTEKGNYILVTLAEYLRERYLKLKRTGCEGESVDELVATEIRKNLALVRMAGVTAPTARAIKTAWAARGDADT